MQIYSKWVSIYIYPHILWNLNDKNVQHVGQRNVRRVTVVSHLRIYFYSKVNPQLHAMKSLRLHFRINHYFYRNVNLMRLIKVVVNRRLYNEKEVLNLLLFLFSVIMIQRPLPGNRCSLVCDVLIQALT